jgi:sugar lactone lactonase YvrE
MGDACKLNPDAADHLQGGSVALRAHLTQSRGAAGVIPAIPGAAGAAGADPRPDPKALHDRLRADTDRYNKWLKAEAIPVMLQMLMAENEAIREVLIDQLSGIKGAAASVALAQRALYDLHPRVRQLALEALRKRPVEEYRKVLLDGFAYPWAAVADHAAEAVVALQMKDAVPQLLSFLDRQDPNMPYEKPGQGQVVREIVKINHPRNCLLCHAQSVNNEDKVRGQVPTTDQSLTPPYYGGTTGTFVRADVTYLKQDFSIPLAVKNPGVWPGVQRFDFLVRERKATPLDKVAARKASDGPASQHKQALFFALRELTGADPGPTVQDWKKHFVERTLEVKTAFTGFRSAVALAVDRAGVAFISDEGQVLRKENNGKPSLWMKGAGSALALDAGGQLLAAHGRTAQVVRIDRENREVKSLADRAFRNPSRLVADRHGGVWFIDGARDDTRPGELYYISRHGSVTHHELDLPRPCGVGIAPDGKTLYVGCARMGEVWAYPVESVGAIGKGRRFAALSDSKGGVADLTVDDDGVVYVLNGDSQRLELFTAEGARAGSARLPDAPVACALGGEGKKTLYVLTQKALLTVEVGKPAPLRTASR